ncbi:MAG: flavodoxin family protein [bacterium]|nr:flavodoxin family protein [bacterium]
MKILGIIGSPHKNGNTAILASKIMQGIKSKNSVLEKIFLDDLNLIPCKACFKCAKNGKCVLKDNFNSVVNKIRQADIIILSSPVYCETVTAQTKILIDRIDSSQVIVTKLKGKTILKRRTEWNTYTKKGIIVCTGDLSPMKEIKQTSSVMKRAFGDLNIKLTDEILARGLTKSGDVLKNSILLEKAIKVGTKLAGIK